MRPINFSKVATENRFMEKGCWLGYFELFLTCYLITVFIAGNQRNKRDCDHRHNAN